MIPTTTMRKSLSDKKLLGSVLVGPSWSAWRVLLIALMGEALTDTERETLTGREREPQAVFGSYLQKYAYPDFYKHHVERNHRELIDWTRGEPFDPKAGGSGEKESFHQGSRVGGRFILRSRPSARNRTNPVGAADA